MITPDLRSISSPDVPDLDSFEQTEQFAVLIDAYIGPAGMPGEERFSVLVASPSWVAAECASQKYLFSRGYLIVEYFDRLMIESAIRELCRKCAGESWDDVGNKLSRNMAWEFDDYNEPG